MDRNAELVKELKIAMQNQPTLSVAEIIDEALSLKYATRRYNTGYMVEKVVQKWKPTNEDIYNAMITYNYVRSL